MKSAPTLRMRMIALYECLLKQAENYRKHGNFTGAGCVATDANYIKAEIAAFDHDLVTALDGADATAATDLYAGLRKPTTAAEAEEALALANQCKPKLYHGTWGWLYPPSNKIRRRAYTSHEAGDPIYIDEYGTRWLKSVIDASPDARFEPDKTGTDRPPETPHPFVSDEQVGDLIGWHKKEACLLKHLGLQPREAYHVGSSVLLNELLQVRKQVVAYQATIDMLTEKCAALQDAYGSSVSKKDLLAMTGRAETAETWPTAESAPKDKTISVLAYYKGVSKRPISGNLDCGRFFPDGAAGSAPFTHWKPLPEIQN